MKLTKGIKTYCQTIRNFDEKFKSLDDKTIIEICLIDKINKLMLRH